MTDRLEHVVVLHRWRDSYALYADYLDHLSCPVSYITTELGRSAVPDSAASVVVVGATDDRVAVSAALIELTDRHGAPSRLVALNEGDLDLAAQLREIWQLPGQRPGELAPFRDKLIMVEQAAAAGLPVPRTADAPDVAAVTAFAAEHGWPVVVKPRRGTASRGVQRLDKGDEISMVDKMDEEPYLVQTALDDPVLHIDGLWTGSALGPWRASRYVNSCADFAGGSFLGSAELDDPALLPVIEDFTARVAAAFGDQPWVFHLEVFLGSEDDGRPRLTFLECGARVGGAEIPFVWREVHGVDLMTAAFAIQLGRQPDLSAIGPAEVGGWLLLPTPVAAPCTVVRADWHGTSAAAARPYAAVVPTAGDRIPRIGGYEHVGARFRFRADSTADLVSAIESTATHFQLDCIPVTDSLAS